MSYIFLIWNKGKVPVVLCDAEGVLYCLVARNPPVWAKLPLEELLDKHSSPCKARLYVWSKVCSNVSAWSGKWSLNPLNALKNTINQFFLFFKFFKNTYFLALTLASGSASAIPFFRASCSSATCFSKGWVGQQVRIISRNSQQLLLISLLFDVIKLFAIMGINRGLSQCWMMNFTHTKPAVAIT